MTETLAYLSGLSCSICYGVSTVLQQEGVKRQKNIDSLRISHAYNMFRQTPYFIGIILDLFGWLFFLYSSHDLPLFLCLSFVAFSLVVSAIIAYLFKGVAISNIEKSSIVLILSGLIIVSIIAQPSVVNQVGSSFKVILTLSLLVTAAAGVYYLRDNSNKYSALILAGLSGLTFGATGIISRIVHYTTFSIHTIFQLLTLVLIGYGILGMFFLAAALQRENVNKINSVLYSFELTVPSLIGILFLGDKVKGSNWSLMILGLFLVTAGSFLVAFEKRRSYSHASVKT